MNKNRIRNATPMSRNVDRLSRIARIPNGVCLIPDCYSGIEFDTAANKVLESFDPFIKNIIKFQSFFFYSRFFIHACLYLLIYKGKAVVI